MKNIINKITEVFEKSAVKNLSLEHIVFLCGATAGIALSAFGAIGNFAMGLHWVSVLIPLINLIIDISSVAYSIIKKRWRGAAVLVYFFASFVLFPFLWFTTGGTMSSSLPLVIGLGVVLIIVLYGKLRGIFFFATLILYSVFIMVELHNPNNFVPYPNREAWYTDVLFGFVLSFLATGGVAYFSLVRYNAANRRSEMLVKQLEVISVTDPLTGVNNRRHLMARLDEEMRGAFDSGNPLTLCIIDIDHFKSVNDTYGHLYGDDVLIKIASTITECLPATDIFGRYGGEEFLIVLPNRDLESALTVITGIYDALKNIDWPHGKPITISSGISTYSKGLSYSKFLENADDNLYKAKNNGRNRMEY